MVIVQKIGVKLSVETEVFNSKKRFLENLCMAVAQVVIPLNLFWQILHQIHTSLGQITDVRNYIE